jgi:hypothetical protein
MFRNRIIQAMTYSCSVNATIALIMVGVARVLFEFDC